MKVKFKETNKVFFKIVEVGGRKVYSRFDDC